MASKSLKKLRPLLLLLPFFVAILALLQFEANRQKVASMEASSKRESPQFFLDQALTTHYTKAGGIDYQLNSEYLEYFGSKNVAHVWKPYFIFHNQEGKSWHSRADQATLFNDNGDIQLTGNVRIWQPDRKLELTTPSLHFSEQRSVAYTDQIVNLQFSAGNTKSIGMKIDLDKENLQLLSFVEGIYYAK